MANDFDLGKSTSYAYYVSEGGTKTPQEFGEMLVNIDTVASRAEESASDAEESATSANESKESAIGAKDIAIAKANEASASADIALNKAGEASASATVASNKANEASASATTASAKATESSQNALTAVGAKNDAVSAKNDAVIAKTQAESAKDDAVTAKVGAESARDQVQSSASQITQNTSDISELKEDLNNAVDVSDYTWVLGSINTSGVIVSATTRVVNTELMPVTEGTKITVSGNANCLLVYRYDAEGSYLGNGGDWASAYTIPQGTVFVRILIRKTSYNSEISTDEIMGQAQRCSVSIKLSRNGVMLGYSTAQLALAVNAVGTNVLSGVTWERGTLDGDGANADSTSRIRTVGSVDVTNVSAILFDIKSGYKYSVFWYDSGNNFIDYTGWLYKSNIFVIPASASSIRLIMGAEPDAWLANASISVNLNGYDKSDYIGLSSAENGNDLSVDWFNATSVNKLEIPTLEAGTTILALGDSITAAQDNTGWVYHFSAMTGCTIIDKAVGGTSFGESATADSGHWMSTQISNVSNQNWTDADLVIVACGTNDYGHGTPLDELKTKVQSAITAIKAKTNVPIVFITPIRRGTSPNSEPMQMLPVIAGIISNVALKNECNVVKGFDFPIPTYNTGQVDNFTQDGLHPNAYGANVYARSVINALI